MNPALLLSLLCVSAMNSKSLGGKVDILRISSGKEDQETEVILREEHQNKTSTLDLLSRLHHRGILNSSHFSYSLLPPPPSAPSSKVFPMFSILSKTSYTTTQGIPTSPTTPRIPHEETKHKPSEEEEEEEEDQKIHLDNPSHHNNHSLNSSQPINGTGEYSSPVSEPVSESFFIGLNKTELAVSAGALLLILLTSVVILLAYFLCRSQFTRRNIYTTMDEHEFNPVSSHFTNPGPPIILDHEHRGLKPKRR